MTDTLSPPAGLSIEGLSVHYGGVRALRRVSLHIEPGEHLILAGPSGSGKSTLLRCIAGLHMPDEGLVRWQGATWTDAAAGAAVAPERRRIGWMTQQPALWPHLSAFDHLSVTLSWRGWKGQNRTSEARRLLDLVSLSHRARHRPAELSGGEAQRLALARALCGSPPLLLLDEPLGQLDLLLRTTMAGEIRTAAEAVGATVLHVTHDPGGMARQSDRLGVIEDGRLAILAPLAEFAAAPPTPFAAAVARSLRGQ